MTKNTQGTTAPSPAPAPSSPASTPMADLLNTPVTVPVKKSESPPAPANSPGKLVK